MQASGRMPLPTDAYYESIKKNHTVLEYLLASYGDKIMMFYDGRPADETTLLCHFPDFEKVRVKPREIKIRRYLSEGGVFVEKMHTLDATRSLLEQIDNLLFFKPNGAEVSASTIPYATFVSNLEGEYLLSFPSSVPRKCNIPVIIPDGDGFRQADMPFNFTKRDKNTCSFSFNALRDMAHAHFGWPRNVISFSAGFPIGFESLVNEPVQIVLNYYMFQDKILQDTELAEKQGYDAISREISSSKYFGDFKHLVEHIKAQTGITSLTPSKDLNGPFICVLGPSGSGKTQLALALDEHVGPCINFVMSRLTGDVQEIYKVSESVSDRLLDNITDDMELIKTHLGSNSLTQFSHKRILEDQNHVSYLCKSLECLVSSCNFVHLIWNLPLKTIGYMFALIQARKEKIALVHGIKYTEMSPLEFYTECFKDPDNRMIICLDEFNLLNPDGSAKIPLLFQRNLTRGLRLPCVTLGTASTGANLIAKNALGTDISAGKFYFSGPWCIVVIKLAEVIVTSVQGYAEYLRSSQRFRGIADWDCFFHWLENDLKTSNPRMVRHAFEGLRTYFSRMDIQQNVREAFLAMLDNIRKETFSLKYNNPETHRTNQLQAMLGQIAYLFPRSKTGLPTSLVHKFFAHLHPPSKWIVGSGKSKPQMEGSVVEVKDLAGLKSYEAYWEADWCYVLVRTLSTAGSLTLAGFTKDRRLVGWSSRKCYLKPLSEENLVPLVMETGINDPEKIGSQIHQALIENPASLPPVNGHIWENFTHLGLIVASAEALRNPFNGGVRLDSACVHILRNLEKVEKIADSKFKSLLPDPNCDLKKLCDKLGGNCPALPFLGPISEEYDFLPKCLGILTSRIRYCKNKEGLDGVSESVICGKNSYFFFQENKKWTDANVAGSTIKSIDASTSRALADATALSVISPVAFQNIQVQQESTVTPQGIRETDMVLDLPQKANSDDDLGPSDLPDLSQIPQYAAEGKVDILDVKCNTVERENLEAVEEVTLPVKSIVMIYAMNITVDPNPPERQGPVIIIHPEKNAKKTAEEKESKEPNEHGTIKKLGTTENIEGEDLEEPKAKKARSAAVKAKINLEAIAISASESEEPIDMDDKNKKPKDSHMGDAMKSETKIDGPEIKKRVVQERWRLEDRQAYFQSYWNPITGQIGFKGHFAGKKTLEEITPEDIDKVFIGFSFRHIYRDYDISVEDIQAPGIDHTEMLRRLTGSNSDLFLWANEELGD